MKSKEVTFVEPNPGFSSSSIDSQIRNSPSESREPPLHWSCCSISTVDWDTGIQTTERKENPQLCHTTVSWLIKTTWLHTPLNANRYVYQLSMNKSKMRLIQDGPQNAFGMEFQVFIKCPFFQGCHCTQGDKTVLHMSSAWPVIAMPHRHSQHAGSQSPSWDNASLNLGQSLASICISTRVIDDARPFGNPIVYNT